MEVVEDESGEEGGSESVAPGKEDGKVEKEEMRKDGGKKQVSAVCVFLLKITQKLKLNRSCLPSVSEKE